MRRLCLALAIFFLSPCLRAQTNSDGFPAQALESGKILPSVQCSARPEQS
jgi:hypothetical protein